MKLKDLFEQQKVIPGNVKIPQDVIQLMGLQIRGIPIYGATINGDFDCSGTKIKSLHGSPSRVGGHFDCSDTAIVSLEGAPPHVDGYFSFHHTKITSLHDVHKHLKYVGDFLWLPHTLTSHVLGVMFIKGLQEVLFFGHEANEKQEQVVAIINKHLPGGNPHDVQQELIEVGLLEFAKI